jgi:hypothetical protein
MRCKKLDRSCLLVVVLFSCLAPLLCGLSATKGRAGGSGRGYILESKIQDLDLGSGGTGSPDRL